MLALAVLFFAVLYLLVSALVVWGAMRMARKRGIKGWKFGLPAALVMYLIVFWDHVPTLVLHKYYCETEAGFWVYKTPEQWDKENPGVLEKLRPYSNPKWASVKLKRGVADKFNDRFGKLDTRQENFDGFILQRKQVSIVDLATEEILARRVDFLAGPRQADAIWKSWLRKDSCFVGVNRTRIYFDEGNLLRQLKMTEEK
jgi:hypothetical protein